MKITKIIVHNIRSIKHTEIELSNYSIFIGPNNAGKSNIMTALRLFYEEKLSFVEDRDFPRMSELEDDESWVEIHYSTSLSEQQSLKEEYQTGDSILRIRRHFKTAKNSETGETIKPGIYAYVGDKLSTTQFYGAKNISSAKLGKAVYIPAASALDKTVNLSGPSPLRDIMNIVMKSVISESESFKSLQSAFSAFNSSFKTETNNDGKSIASLVDEINQGIGSWGVNFGIDVKAIEPEAITKSLFDQHLTDSSIQGNNKRLETNSFGHGLQRHLIYTLIKLAAKHAKKKQKATKDFNPDFTLLLFEEPEVFLHPVQQETLTRSLRTLSASENQQVLITSHSPTFVSRNFDDIPSIIKVRRDHGSSHYYQVRKNLLANIANNNLKFYESNSGTQIESEMSSIEVESMRYFLYLNSERSEVFFSDHVLICEGQTEKVLFEYLIERQWSDLAERNICFMEALGKFNIPRFMELFHHLGISYSVIFDGDNKKSSHLIYNDYIKKNALRHHCFDRDVEDFLGVTSPKRSGMKPLSLVCKCASNEVEEDRLNRLKAVVQRLTRQDK